MLIIALLNLMWLHLDGIFATWSDDSGIDGKCGVVYALLAPTYLLPVCKHTDVSCILGHSTCNDDLRVYPSRTLEFHRALCIYYVLL